MNRKQVVGLILLLLLVGASAVLLYWGQTEEVISSFTSGGSNQKKFSVSNFLAKRYTHEGAVAFSLRGERIEGDLANTEDVKVFAPRFYGKYNDNESVSFESDEADWQRSENLITLKGDVKAYYQREQASKWGSLEIHAQTMLLYGLKEELEIPGHVKVMVGKSTIEAGKMTFENNRSLVVFSEGVKIGWEGP